MIINIILLPICYQRTLKNVAYFSFVAMVMTFISFVIMFYISYDIYYLPKH